jgi:hypothetical protein
LAHALLAGANTVILVVMVTVSVSKKDFYSWKLFNNAFELFVLKKKYVAEIQLKMAFGFST